MRIVLDTNILVRATPSATGPAREVLDRLLDGPHFLVLSTHILVELMDVLMRPKVQKMHGLDVAATRRFVERLQDIAVVVHVRSALADGVVPRDPDDEPVIATAIEGGAQVICTRDAHLLDPTVAEWCSRCGIRVMDERSLLALLRSEKVP